MLTLTLAAPTRRLQLQFNGDADASGIAWASTRPEVATVAPAADGLRALITRVAPGETQITVATAHGAAAPLDVTVPALATAVTIAAD